MKPSIGVEFAVKLQLISQTVALAASLNKYHVSSLTDQIESPRHCSNVLCGK